MSITLAPYISLTAHGVQGHAGPRTWYRVCLHVEGIPEGMVVGDPYQTDKEKAKAFADLLAAGLLLTVVDET